MTSATFSGFWIPSPLVTVKFTQPTYKIYRLLGQPPSTPPPPMSAEVINGSILSKCFAKWSIIVTYETEGVLTWCIRPRGGTA